jgi:hypothetical protein
LVKSAIVLLLLSMCACLYAQDTAVFVIKKTDASIEKPKVQLDTFLQKIFVSEATEKKQRIVYRTGIRLLNENTLVFFNATQSIIDSLKILEDKNASVGDFQKLKYVMVNDTIMFAVEKNVPSRTVYNRTIKITYTYTAYISTANPVFEITSTSDLASEVPNKISYANYKLYRTDYLIRPVRNIRR